MRKILRYPGSKPARLREGRVRSVRDKIKRAESNGKVDRVFIGANARDDLTQNSRSIFKTSSVSPRARVRAEKFVQQVTVAMFDVHKIRARLPGNARGANVIFDEFIDLRVRENLRIRRDAKFCVEDRMSKRNARLEPALVIGFAKPPRMRQLKSDHQILRASESLAMNTNERLTNLRSEERRV